MTLLDPVLGGKIRAVLVTLFAVFTAVLTAFPDISDQGWTGTVVKLYGLALVIIEILTHATDVGNGAGPPYGD